METIDPNMRETAPDVERKLDLDTIVPVLTAYREEGENAKLTGPVPRDEVWRRNWDLYWGKFDWSQKADWQAKVAMPEAQQFVDRWAAAMRLALVQAGDWYSVKYAGDGENDLAPHIRKFMDWMLCRCGRNQSGHPVAFPAVFEQLMKLGAISAMCATVTPAEGIEGNYIAISPVNPAEVTLDPQGRGLYRVRRYTVEKHELVAMIEERDSAGDPLWNLEEVERLVSHLADELRSERERASGHGQEVSSTRKPITLDEYLCDILLPDGTVAGRNVLTVIANSQFVVRGPEKNPFWHKRDWLVYAPMIQVPLSVYGKSYMENWAQVAVAFNEMTNMILDAVYVSSMNAFAVVADMLKDPTQLTEGITPNMTFELEDGSSPREFIKEIELGKMSADSITIWQGMKSELRDGALLNELSLGQVPPKGAITATEIQEASSGSSAFTQSIAESVEENFLNVALTLTWQAGLQHVDFTDEVVVKALGEETARMLEAAKEEFRKGPVSFEARGISSLIERGQKLRSFMSLLQVVAQNDGMMKEFFERYDAGSVLDHLMMLHGIDGNDLKPTDREAAVRRIVRQYAAANQNEGAAPGMEALGG